MLWLVATQLAPLTCLVPPPGCFQCDSLLLDLRGEVRIFAPFPRQRSRPVSEGVLDHLEDVSELFQALLGGLGLFTLTLHRALEVFD